MVKALKWKSVRGMRIRLRSALRCLFGNHYVLVCWERCEDGELDFKISHKGVELPEAMHRLKVDAVDILQDRCDQDDAIDEVNAQLSRNI
jgi:hypothetical protein